MIRKGWLEARERGDLDGARALRGQEPFVAVSWERAQRLVELGRVRDRQDSIGFEFRGAAPH